MLQNYRKHVDKIKKGHNVVLDSNVLEGTSLPCQVSLLLTRTQAGS
jgi:hypothetical protein